MNAIKITALAFLFLFTTSAVQGDVVNFTTAGHTAGSLLNGSSEWTVENTGVDATPSTSRPPITQDAYVGDADTNRNILRNAPGHLLQASPSTLQAYYGKDDNAGKIVTQNNSLNEGFIKISTKFELSIDNDADARWSFSPDNVITLTSSNKLDTTTTILFAEIQQDKARIVGLEQNGDKWTANGELSSGSYTLAVYAYFDVNNQMSYSKNFYANATIESVSATPEPATVILFGLGIAATIAATRKRRRR